MQRDAKQSDAKQSDAKQSDVQQSDVEQSDAKQSEGWGWGWFWRSTLKKEDPTKMVGENDVDSFWRSWFLWFMIVDVFGTIRIESASGPASGPEQGPSRGQEQGHDQDSECHLRMSSTTPLCRYTYWLHHPI